MKLQLNEETLNAYLNEAIRRELNENFFTGIGKGLSSVGTGIVKGTKGAAKGAGKYGKALMGNRGAVKTVADEMDAILKKPEYKNLFKEFNIDSIDQLPKDVRKNPKKLLQFVRDMQKKNTDVHNAWKNKNNMIFNKDLGNQGDNLVKLERELTAAINGTNLARVGTAAAAGGFGAGYLAGRSRNGGQDPNAPWNDENNDPGMNDDVQNDTGGNEINGGGFDGTFPWDDIEPQWTPRRPRPQVQQPTQPVQPQQPAQPARTRIEPLASVQAPANLPTGAVSNQAGQTIQRNYAPGTNPANVNKWNNTANFRKMSGQAERGVAPEKIAGTVQNRHARQEKRYDKINAANDSQNQGSAQ